MRNLRLTNGIEKLSDANLLVKTTVITSSMAGNANFPTPVPSLNEVNGAFGAFQAAVQKAEGGNNQDILVKNELKANLVKMLHLLGNYVLFTSAGDFVKASSSGYQVSKVPSPEAPLTTPEGLQLKNGVNKGELKFSFKKVQGARSYRFEITPSPITADSVWEASTNTITKKQYSGLESGKEYNCRVAAYGIKEQVVYSDVVSRIAL